MSRIQIMTDSASDISMEAEREYNISVIPFPISLGDKSYTSRVDFDNQQFYDLMAQCDGRNQSVSSQPASASSPVSYILRYYYTAHYRI